MSRRVIDYRLEQVLASPRRDGLDHGRIESFADLAADGWQPWGPPVFSSGDPFQPLVKYAAEPESPDWPRVAAMVQQAINAERDAVVAYAKEWGEAYGGSGGIAVLAVAKRIEAAAHHEAKP